MEVVKNSSNLTKKEEKGNNIFIEEMCDAGTKKQYHVVAGIPMNMGWIFEPTFNTISGKERVTIPMKHKENKKGISYFECNAFLRKYCSYNYYVNYKANCKNYFLTKSNNPYELKEDNMFSIGEEYKTPSWAKGKIMAHIFVDRFYRGQEDPMQEMPRRVIHKSWNEEIKIDGGQDGIWNNDFYGGDLKGIKQKLDYFKSLGITILYLSPIVKSQSNHRYDTGDYEVIDPYAGTMDDLKELCTEAHKNGMKIILDSVFNHTGNDSKYYNEYGSYNTNGAYNNINSPYSSFYRKYNGQNCFWWGFKNLPECDCNSKEWQNYITGECGVIDKWFNAGIDGLRLDVADELSDDFLELIKIAVKRNRDDGLIIGEVWKNPMRENRKYTNYMDTVMNYQLVDALIRYFKYCDVNKLNWKIAEILGEYPTDYINTLMNFTSTHDITRAINIFANYDFKPFDEWPWEPINGDRKWQRDYKLSKVDYEIGRQRFQAYAFTLAFLPGILSIFYGDEIGMQGMGNLANRRPFTWDNIDTEILSVFKKIGNIRAKEKFLEEAKLNVIDINDSIFMFERINEKTGESAVISVNRTDVTRCVTLPDNYTKTNEKVYTLNKSTTKFLNPYGAVAVKKLS